MLRVLKNQKVLFVIHDRINHIQKVPVGGVLLKVADADIEVKGDSSIYSYLVAGVNAHNSGSDAEVDIERKTVNIKVKKG